MKLRLSELREVANKAIDDRKASDALIKEVKRAFGRHVDVGSDVNEIAERANYVLDTMDVRGAAFNGQIDMRVVRAAKTHRDAEVRKFVARLLPLTEARKMILDEDPCVRHAVARRMPARIVLEALKSWGDDDELDLIYHTKKIQEAANVSTKLTGDVIKQQEYPELSDNFYDTLARQFLVDYGGLNFQQNWGLAVKRYASSLKATSGIEIDTEKLLEAIENIHEEREDEIADETHVKLQETIDYLATQMDVLDESLDVVDELLRSGAGASDFIERVVKAYNVKESFLPPTFKKHCLGENAGKVTFIPQRASTPHGKAMTERDERVLDRFVEAWNKRQALCSEPLKLSWYINPCDASSAGFSIKLV